MVRFMLFRISFPSLGLKLLPPNSSSVSLKKEIQECLTHICKHNRYNNKIYRYIWYSDNPSTGSEMIVYDPEITENFRSDSIRRVDLEGFYEELHRSLQCIASDSRALSSESGTYVDKKWYLEAINKLQVELSQKNLFIKTLIDRMINDKIAESVNIPDQNSQALELVTTLNHENLKQSIGFVKHRNSKVNPSVLKFINKNFKTVQEIETEIKNLNRMRISSLIKILRILFSIVLSYLVLNLILTLLYLFKHRIQSLITQLKTSKKASKKKQKN